MKSSEIKVGEHYAYKAWKRAEPTKATVLEVGATVPVQFAPYRAPHSGIRIEFRNHAGTKTTEVVKPQTITEPWENYAAAKKVEDDWRKKSIEAMKADAATIKSLLPKKVYAETLGLRELGKVYADGSYTRSVRLDVASLAEIVQAAYEAGRKSAEESA